ncbi:hypothetical protein GCM10027280_33870 [Micromonospora polyrhachis]
MSVGIVAPPTITRAAVPGRLVVLARQDHNLSIIVPSAVSLGAARTGTTLGGRLGTVTIDDQRLVNPNTWTATVSATSFQTGAGGTGRTIPNTQLSYWSGPETKSTGGGTLIPGQLTPAQAQSLGVPRIAFRKTSGNGNNRVSWNPTLVVAVPTGITAGLYVGTITHSVA